MKSKDDKRDFKRLTQKELESEAEKLNTKMNELLTKAQDLSQGMPELSNQALSKKQKKILPDLNKNLIGLQSDIKKIHTDFNDKYKSIYSTKEPSLSDLREMSASKQESAYKLSHKYHLVRLLVESDKQFKKLEGTLSKIEEKTPKTNEKHTEPAASETQPLVDKMRHVVDQGLEKVKKVGRDVENLVKPTSPRYPEVYYNAQKLNQIIDQLNLQDNASTPSAVTDAASALWTKLNQAMTRYTQTVDAITPSSVNEYVKATSAAKEDFKTSCREAINAHKDDLMIAPGVWNQIKKAVNDLLKAVGVEARLELETTKFATDAFKAQLKDFKTEVREKQQGSEHNESPRPK